MSEGFYHPTFRLRFVERDGERILQYSQWARVWDSPGWSEPRWSKWQDVPLEMETDQ